MSRSHDQRHLVLGTQINGLDILAPPRIPEVQAVTILAGQYILHHDTILELVRFGPLARYEYILGEGPPEAGG